MLPYQQGDSHALVLHPDCLVTLDSYRLNRFQDDGSLAHLALGRTAQEIADCREAMFAARDLGREDWFECSGAERFYTKAGEVLRLRDEFYFDPPLTIFDPDLKLSFRSRADRSELRIPINSSSLPVFGELLARLRPSTSVDQLRRTADDSEWSLLEVLITKELLQFVELQSLPAPSEYHIALAGHSCLVVDTPNSSVLIDPLLVLRHRPEVRLEHFLTRHYDAIIISHPHWDHLNLDSLLLVDRNTPIVVPKLRSRPSIVNIDMRRVCEELGFHNVLTVEPWESLQFGDVEFVSLPFYGEGSGPEGRQDWQTYYLRCGGKSALGVVDACADHFGSMDDVMREVHERFGPVDLLFSPCANFHFQASHFYKKPFVLSRALEQFTGSAEDTLRWAELVKARWILPYAEFAYEHADFTQPILNPAQFGTHADLFRMAPRSLAERIIVLSPQGEIRWSKDGELRLPPSRAGLR